MILRSFDGKIIQNDFDNNCLLKCEKSAGGCSASPQKHHIPLLFLENKSSEMVPGCSVLRIIESQTREFPREAGTRVEGRVRTTWTPTKGLFLGAEQVRTRNRLKMNQKKTRQVLQVRFSSEQEGKHFPGLRRGPVGRHKCRTEPELN